MAKPFMVQLSEFALQQQKNRTLSATKQDILFFYNQIQSKFPNFLKITGAQYIDFHLSLAKTLAQGSLRRFNFRKIMEMAIPGYSVDKDTLYLRNFVFYPGINYANIDFFDVEFNRVCFAGCNLAGSHFDRVHKEECSLASTQSNKIIYHNSTLLGVDYMNAKMPYSIFNATNVTSCRFKHANLPGSHIFTNSTFLGCSFESANIEGMRLGRRYDPNIQDNSMLNGNDYFKADLSGATFLCDTTTETGEYLNNTMAAPLAEAYAAYFSGQATNGKSECAQQHAQRALDIQNGENSPIISSLVPGFLCDAGFVQSTYGGNTFFLGKPGKSGMRELEKQGAITTYSGQNDALCKDINYSLRSLMIVLPIVGMIGIFVLIAYMTNQLRPSCCSVGRSEESKENAQANPSLIGEDVGGNNLINYSSMGPR